MKKIISYVLILTFFICLISVINYIVQGWTGYYLEQMMWFVSIGLISLILSSLVYGRDSYLVLVFRMTAKRIELHKEKMKKELKNE